VEGAGKTVRRPWSRVEHWSLEYSILAGLQIGKSTLFATVCTHAELGSIEDGDEVIIASEYACPKLLVALTTWMLPTVRVRTRVLPKHGLGKTKYLMRKRSASGRASALGNTVGSKETDRDTRGLS
jgi:hypothetical protein